MVKLSTLALGALAAATAQAWDTTQDASALSVDGVADVLRELNLYDAFGDYFAKMNVDGVMLTEYLTPEDIDVTLLADATPAHVRKLFGELARIGIPTTANKHPQLTRPAAKTDRAPPRKLEGKSTASLVIQRDDSSIVMGSDKDVSIARTGDGELTVDASLVVTDTISVPTLDSIVDSSSGRTVQEACDAWTHVFVGDDPVDVKQSQLITKSFQAAADYELSIDINPYGTVGQWSNVFHFTATEDNCCSYGDRIPALFIYANTVRMHYVFGSAYDLDMDSEQAQSNGDVGNTKINMDSGDNLPMGQWTNVLMRVKGTTASLYLNGTLYATEESDTRHPHDDVSVYLSDPWYLPAEMYVKNFKYRVLSYLQTEAYDHDFDSTTSLGQYDDDSTITRTVSTMMNFEEEVFVASFNDLVDASTGKTVQEACDAWTHTFIGDTQVAVKEDQLLTPSFQAAADYELTIDIMPTGTYNGWTNVFHFTTSGDNCCNYGDRIPALFIYANTARFHYVMGSAADLDLDSDQAASNGNVGNTKINAEDSIPMNQWTTVLLRAVGDTATLYFNGTEVGSVETDTRHPHDATSVWLSDPWYEEARCNVKNFKYRVLSYIQTDAYAHTLDSSTSLGQY